jgi:hypothetical protein
MCESVIHHRTECSAGCTAMNVPVNGATGVPADSDSLASLSRQSKWILYLYWYYTQRYGYRQSSQCRK